MNRRLWKKWVASLLLGTAWVGGLVAEQPLLPQDSYFNSRNLTIPIVLPGNLRSQISKLTLYVSTDQGKTWRQEATASPTEDSFKFDAAADGIYWFNVSYTDQSGQTSPKEAEIYGGPPQLKVLVDTQRPVLKINVGERQGDQVNVTWEAKDEAIDAAKVKLEYKVEGTEEWRPLDLGSNVSKGQKKYTVGTNAAVQFRMTASDIAGNQALQQAEAVAYTPPATTSVNAKPASSDGTKPAGKPLTMTNEGPALPTPPIASSSTPTGGMNAPAAPPSLPMPGGDSFRPANPAPAGPAPVATNTPTATNMPTTPPPAAPVTPPTASESSGRPMNGNQPLATNAPATSYAQPTTQRGGVPLNYTNQTKLELDYEIPRMGPSGIGSVELWVTTDNGRTWQKGGETTEANTPFVHEVASDGIYGFTMIVKSKAGLGRKEPAAGDAPELRVEVDTKAPTVTLYPVEADPRRKDMLFLIWKVEDRNLGATPITLQYSEKPGGPWQSIVENYSNRDGRYAWKMPENLPYRIYLRLEARDQAGNLGVAETPEPVLVDLTEPEIKIKGLRPSGRR